MITLRLHGPLRAYHSGEITFAGVATLAEAIEAMTRQLPQFAPHPVYGRQAIRAIGFDDFDDYHTCQTDPIIVDILPELVFAKQGGIQTIIGTVLVVTGFFLPPGFREAVMTTGISMILSGVVMMLAPQPEISEAETQSRVLGSSSTNSVKSGTPIPILYGRAMVRGQILSQDFDARTIR